MCVLAPKTGHKVKLWLPAKLNLAKPGNFVPQEPILFDSQRSSFSFPQFTLYFLLAERSRVHYSEGHVSKSRSCTPCRSLEKWTACHSRLGGKKRDLRTAWAHESCVVTSTHTLTVFITLNVKMIQTSSQHWLRMVTVCLDS